MDDIVAIYHRQRRHFKTNATLETACRIRHLRQIDKMLRDNEESILLSLEKDLGKSPTEGYITELGLVYKSLRLAISKVSRWSRRERVRTPLYLGLSQSFTQPMPYGHVLIIDAYNYPLLLALDPLIGAIAAGNVAMVALSDRTPHFNQVMLKLTDDYLEDEVIYFFEGNKEINQELLTQPFDKIFFTGSQAVGQSVLAAASQFLTPVTLELGGKSPALITATADIEQAAEQIAWGKFVNAGQTCVAPDYCLVDKQVSAEFTMCLEKSIQRLYGQDAETSADYGRLIDERATDRMIKLLEQDKPAIVTGGSYTRETGYVEPTLLKGELATELASMKEEIFGPILPIISYDSLADARRYLAEQPAPLAFYPFSRDKKELRTLLKENQFGGATVNDTVLHLANPYLPFGGVGPSGMGSYHGKQSFDTFSHRKSILRKYSTIGSAIMKAPYTAKKLSWIKRLLK